jgi:hypothetical protein
MPKPAATLPANILDWLESTMESTAATDTDVDASASSSAAAAVAAPPVVFISFGASFLAPQAAMPALAAALAATRGSMRFLLRMRDSEQQQLQDALQQLGVQLTAAELLVLPHVPQNDVLGHPAVAAFVTQGGYLSMQVGHASWCGQYTWLLLHWPHRTAHWVPQLLLFCRWGIASRYDQNAAFASELDLLGHLPVAAHASVV